MKKFTLGLFTLIFVSASIFAGNNPARIKPFNNKPVPKINGITFYTQDFSGGTIPVGWQTADSSGSQIDWHWTNKGSKNLPGNLTENALSTSGTTAANGYMIFDSDSGGGVFGPENSWLISAAISATGKTNVHLSFNEFFAQYLSSTAVVWVSNDGTTWTDVHHSETGILQDQTTANPNVVDIDISGVADNQATVYVAFQWTGYWDYFWMFDDVTLYEVANSDAGVIDIWQPTTGCNVLTDTEKVSISIFNYGGDSLHGFDVAYKIDGSAPVVEPVPDTIAPGVMLDYTFTTRGDFSVPGMHTVTAYSKVPADADMSNDTFQVSLYNGPHTVPPATGYTMDFEAGADLSGWSFVDANSDGISWTLSNTVPHGGSLDIMYSKNIPNATNDWLFSTCLKLDSGQVYQVSFWYRTFSPATNAVMFSTLNTDQTPTSNVLTIFPIDTVKNFTWLQYIKTFTAPGKGGTFYVGWQVQNDPAKNTSLLIDDFNISTTTGVSAFGSANKEVVVYPNPNNGSFAIRNLDTFKGQVNVTVYDMMGKVVYNKDVVNQSKLDLNLNQPSGIYSVRITSEEGVVNRLVTIN